MTVGLYDLYFSTLDVGFACVQCSATTLTLRGMILHQAVCHGVIIPTPPGNTDPDPVSTGDLPRNFGVFGRVAEGRLGER